MHIGIEATPLRSPASGGVFRYTDCLIQALGRTGLAARFSLLFFNSWKPWARVVPSPVPSGRTMLREVVNFPSHAFTLYASLGFRPRGRFSVESFLGPVDVFHSVNALAVPQRAGRRVLTIHDLTCLRTPQHHPWLRVALFRVGTRRSARMADAIVVPCRQTQRDVVELLGVPEHKVRVIPYAPAASFGQVSMEVVAQTLSRYGLLPGKFFLFVGNLEPRKNLLGLIRAYERLRRVVKEKPLLVLVGGRGWRNHSIHRAIGASPFSGDIRVLGFVPDRDLAAIMTGAALFVYPSFYEGFGLPVVEAMACGTPVITSAVSSLQEVVGNAALLVDPTDVGGLADAMCRVLTDKVLRETLRSKGLEQAKLFSWEETARRTLRVYEEVSAVDRAGSS